MNTSDRRKQALTQIWNAAVSAVCGREAVHHAISKDGPFAPDLILAVGKAAVGMCRGALDHFPTCDALVITKYGHADDDIQARDNVVLIESAHPILDHRSLEAGQLLVREVRNMKPGSRLLMLVSGGASALSEALPDGFNLADLQLMADDMISTGKTIAQINDKRKQTSLIKDGKLLQLFAGAEIRVYAISDVEGDSISTIGSGLGDCHRVTCEARSTIVASNQIARARAAVEAAGIGLEVKLNEESLYGDVFELAHKISNRLKSAEPGVYIWGGEPTVVLPDNPGQGGRNQSLALAISGQISGRHDISVLVAGTDGSDGPTNAAGGLVDGDTFSDSLAATEALQQANAGPYLASHGSLFVTGPTNTNVMDLLIAIID